VNVVRSVAQAEGATAAQVALSWLTNRPAVASPIIGARNMAQLTDNLQAADLHLSPESTALLDKVSQPRPNDYPYGAFGRKQVDRYVASSEQVLTELFAPSAPDQALPADGAPGEQVEATDDR
jgi:aryl-alcohol dehydrogenase (NADP+)